MEQKLCNMENKTALQELIERLKGMIEHYDPQYYIGVEAAINSAQSLLPLEKEGYRKCFEAGGGYYSDRVSNAPDFPTWFRQFETEQLTDKT